MTFSEEFPSLTGEDDELVDNKELCLYHGKEIRKHCLDKERVRKVFDEIVDGCGCNTPECWARLRKELGL